MMTKPQRPRVAPQLRCLSLRGPWRSLLAPSLGELRRRKTMQRSLWGDGGGTGKDVDIDDHL